MHLRVPGPFRHGPPILLLLLLLCGSGAEAQTQSSTPIGQSAEPEGSDAPVAAEQQLENQRRLEAERQLRQQEHQRIFGLLPNFNTTDAARPVFITPGQKFRLAAKTAFDPFTFGIAAATAAVGQAQDSFHLYGQGAQGYGKRLGAAYADSVDGTLIGNALLPILLHQDPRYFRKGTGTFSSRLLYAISTTVRARNDNGRWAPNYSNVLGNVAAGGISNLYYPSSDRGVGLTFERASVVTAQGAFGAILVEFWPDVSRHFAKKRLAKQTAAGKP